jgi:hypothetical protein
MTKTTLNGLTMEWHLIRKHHYNAANPFTLVGAVDGVCRMECGISRQTAYSPKRMTTIVIGRLREIEKERSQPQPTA